MAKQVGLRFTVEEQQALDALKSVSHGLSGVSRSARQLTTEGADVEAILASIGQRGGEAFDQLIAKSRAEGASMRDLQQSIVNLARTQITASKEQRAQLIAEARAARETATQSDEARAKAGEALDVLVEKSELASTGLGRVARGVLSINQKLATSKEFAAGAGLTAFAAGGAQVTRSMMEAGEELDRLQRQMTAALGNEDAAKPVVDQIRHLHVELGLSEDDLSRGASSLQKFGVLSKGNLEIAATAARATQESVRNVSEALGRFMKFGDSRSALTLKRALGIDPTEVAQTIGLLDQHGRVLLNTREDADKFRAAMKAALATKYPEVKDATSDVSKLSGALNEFNQDAGHVLVDWANEGAKALQPLANMLIGSPHWFKGVVAGGVAVSSALAGIAGPAMMVISTMNSMKAAQAAAGAAAAAGATETAAAAGAEGAEAVAATTAATATGAFATVLGVLLAPLTAAVAAVLAVGAAFHAYTAHVEAANRAANELLHTQEKLARWLHEDKDLIGKTAAQVAAMGKGAQDVARLIASLTEERDKASQRGNTAEAEKIARQIAYEHQVLDGIRRISAAHAAADTQRAHEPSRAMHAWDAFERDRQAGVYETRDAELKAQDAVLAHFQENGKLMSAAQLQAHGMEPTQAARVEKQLQAAQAGRTRLAREAADERVKNALHALDVETAAGRMSTQQRAQQIATLSRAEGISIAERQQLELQAARTSRQATEETLQQKLQALRSEREAGTITYTQEAAQLRSLMAMRGLNAHDRERLSAQATHAETQGSAEALRAQVHSLQQQAQQGRITHDAEAQALNDILATHRLTAAQRAQIEQELTTATKAAIADRLSAELNAMHIRVAQGRATVEDEVALLRRQANEPGLDPKQRSAKLLEAANTQHSVDAHRAQQQKELAHIRQQQLRDEESSLRARAAAGEDTTAQMIALKHREYASERAEIQATAAADARKWGQSETGAALLAARLHELDAKERAADTKIGETRLRYLDQLLHKLDAVKQKESDAMGLHAGPKSIQDAFKGGSDFGFSLHGQSHSRTQLPGGITAADLAFLRGGGVDPNDPRVAALYARAHGGASDATSVPGTPTGTHPMAAGSPGTSAGPHVTGSAPVPGHAQSQAQTITIMAQVVHLHGSVSGSSANRSPMSAAIAMSDDLHFTSRRS